MTTRFDDHLYCLAGCTIKGSFSVPNGTLLNAHIAASAGLAANKLEHQHVLHYAQDDGSDVVSAIVPIYVVRGVTATVIEIEVDCLDSPTGGDKKFTVDLQKANAGTPTPATILSAVVDYVNGTADCVVLTGTISSADLVVGDILLLVIVVSGSTGTQGQGVAVSVTVREDAE